MAPCGLAAYCGGYALKLSRIAVSTEPRAPKGAGHSVSSGRTRNKTE